jgi:hypothetical protein
VSYPTLWHPDLKRFPHHVARGIEEVRAVFDEYGARDWVIDTYRRHRPPSAAV